MNILVGIVLVAFTCSVSVAETQRRLKVPNSGLYVAVDTSSLLRAYQTNKLATNTIFYQSYVSPGKITLRSAKNNLLACVQGDNSVRATGNSPDDNCQFTLIMDDADHGSLLAYNGNYVCPVAMYNGFLYASTNERCSYKLE